MSLKKVTLNDLNVDVLYLILLTLHDVSRHSLFSVLRANQALHDVALQVLYRSCVLDVSPGQRESTVARIESWLKESSFMLSLIRNITLKGSVYHYQHNEVPVDTDQWNFVIQLLAGIPSLASFTFDYPEQLPIILLDALHKYHPSSHLHIRNWTRIATDTPFGDPAEEALANSPCLRSLHGHFVTGASRSADFRNAAFDRIAKLSPNLTAISRSSRSAGGCVIYGIFGEEMLRQGQERKKFSVETPHQKSVQSVEIGYVNAHALRELGSYVLLDRIVTFKSPRLTSDFFYLASEDQAYRFSSLKFLEVKLGSGEIAAAFSGFLASCGPLESLSIVLETSQPWGLTLSAILQHHSQSIRTLSLHQVESHPKGSIRQCLSLDELVEIRHACPELASLALDIDRNKQESAYYDILGQFRHLYELTVQMDLGLAQPSIYPRADEEFALNIWKKVSNDGVQLRELVLYLGEQDREVGNGYPAFWVLQEQQKRHWVKIRRNERDDKPREIELKMSRDLRAEFIKRVNDRSI